MELNKYITIVIPCKNEGDIILKTLDLLNYQSGINGVKVIVCDASNDGVTKPDLIARLMYGHTTDMFELHLMDGGLPAKARNNGFKRQVFIWNPKNIGWIIIIFTTFNSQHGNIKFKNRYNI